MKILVVDDNTSITNSLEKYLKIKGFDVSITNNGKTGYELIQTEHWDTILLDLSMPEYSGLNIIEDLEKNDQLKDKNIILFTASSVPDYVLNKLLEKEGIKMCLRKPISLSKIVDTIAA